MKKQKKVVLDILKSGKTLTSIDGLILGIIRLTNRINELRADGYNIHDKWITSKKGKRFKSYFMPKKSTNKL